MEDVDRLMTKYKPVSDCAETWHMQPVQHLLDPDEHERTQAPPEELDLEQEIAQLDTPLRPRDGVQQVRQAAERVAKGHDGADRTAVRTAESVLWAPGEAMAKLWDTMKTLEGSAENREVKLEELRFGELKSQRDAAQDELREIERQDKQISRSLRCVRELEEIAWSLGGLLDEKSAKCKQAITMLSQIEADFALKEVGASLAHPPEEDEDKEEEPDESEQRARREQALLARRARRQERRKRQGSETRSQEGWETSDAWPGIAEQFWFGWLV
eukprot:g11076.t1